MNGFYKLEGNILFCSQLVIDTNFSLDANSPGDNSYPIGGWSYYDTYEAAAIALNLPEGAECVLVTGQYDITTPPSQGGCDDD